MANAYIDKIAIAGDTYDIQDSAARAILEEPQNSNVVFAGPVTGAAASPSFRPLVSTDLPIATTSIIGGVKIGTGLSIDSAGVLSSNNSITIDSILDAASDNPVKNSVITVALDNKADNSDIPIYLSDLINNTGYITEKELPDISNFITLSDIPKDVSFFNNDAGYITDAGVTSFNGSTGDITYTAPVTSVNGQTGIVRITPPEEVVISSTEPDNTNGYIKIWIET